MWKVPFWSLYDKESRIKIKTKWLQFSCKLDGKGLGGDVGSFLNKVLAILLCGKFQTQVLMEKKKVSLDLCSKR